MPIALRQRHAGQRSCSRPGSIATSTGLLKIGGNAIWGEWFNGLIDEVRDLQPDPDARAEIQADMNAGRRLTRHDSPDGAGRPDRHGRPTSAHSSWARVDRRRRRRRYNVHRCTTAGFTPAARTGSRSRPAPATRIRWRGHVLLQGDRRGRGRQHQRRLERGNHDGRRRCRAECARNADGDRSRRTRDALMGRGDGQRGRRPLQRPPRHEFGLHAGGGQPDCAANRDGIHGQHAQRARTSTKSPQRTTRATSVRPATRRARR